jgi:hypothetical protein
MVEVEGELGVVEVEVEGEETPVRENIFSERFIEKSSLQESGLLPLLFLLGLCCFKGVLTKRLNL